MNNIITKIEIDSFRSFRRVTIDAGNINLFSGLNDVGKSNVLKALNLFFNGQTDFGTDYVFENDYSKVSFAAAQRSNKKKQQVRIRVYLKIPDTYKTLSGDIWLERIFDRYGRVTENHSHDSAKQKAAITRIVNNIRYFYIPALKGSDVLKYILSEVGGTQLISEQNVADLNTQVNDNIKDLASILAYSAIQNETRFELPVLVRDFWEKLSINTTYDQFSELDKKIGASKKGTKEDLKKEFFQIPLLLRGDGIKSKFIPPLLLWIQRHDPKKFYVWGIDEPENSLEFKRAQQVADLYFSVYAVDTQLFLTSHSLAFIFPESVVDLSIFRCIKGELGETKIELLKSLFEEQDRKQLAEEIGALEVQKSFYDDWRQKDAEIESLKRKIENSTKPLIVTEGNNILHIKKAISILDAALLPKIDFLEGAESKTGSDQMKTTFEIVAQRKNGHKILFVWDCDQTKKVSALSETGTTFKYCIQKNNDNNKVQKGIENLYPESVIFDEHYSTKEEIDGYGAKKTIQNFEKQKFMESINKSKDTDVFKNFKPLVEKIKNIICDQPNRNQFKNEL